MNISCPVCNNASCQKAAFQYGTSEMSYRCPRCGSFVFPEVAQDIIDKRIKDGSIDRSVLSHHLRKMQRPDGHIVKLCREDLQAFIDDHQLPTPQEQLNNLILLIGNKQPNPASYASIAIEEVAAYIGTAVDTVNTGEPNFSWLWSEISNKNIFRQEQGQGNKILLKLTMLGWELFEKLRHQTEDSYKAFMAMAFNQADIASMLAEHFKPAVTRAGFDLKSLNEGQPAGLIDNQIRSAIRTAAFVVADLTHANNGAYFEAGFAEGLGVPVLYTCEESVFKERKTHFDTNHMVTIPWSLDRPNEAANLLTATIRATLPTKAKLYD